MQADTGQTNGVATIDDTNILRALQIIQNPLTDNTVRRNASDYLEQLKGNTEAVDYGYRLGFDKKQVPLVRHFGLSLLEHAIRHQWHTLTDEQTKHARDYVTQLGQSISSSDQPFIRNKVAQLWVELAKRSWALDWFDLDAILIQIWSQSFECKELVLAVLENLSEDLFTREDSAAVLRGRDLGTALVDIFTSKDEHGGDIKIGSSVYQIRSSDEGWLSRINTMISGGLQATQESPETKRCLIKALAALRSALSWMMTAAIINSGTLPTICNCLMQQDQDMLIAGIEALLALYGRSRLEDPDVESLVYPMCQPENCAILQQLYDWSVVSVDEIESSKYTISKKLSEMISQIADYISQKPPSSDTNIDFSFFLKFMIRIAQHESPIVSIPVIHSWTKLLTQKYWRKSQAVNSCMGSLLEFACQRTLQYDMLPDQENEPAVVFVHDEIELFPERQGFFLNYRKLCCQLIELISYTHLNEAISHLTNHVDAMLDQLQDSEKSFDPSTYSKGSISALHADVQFTNIEAAFRGFSAWKAVREENPSQQELEARSATTAQIRAWAVDLLSKRHFRDPLIKQRMIKSAVEISNKALKLDTDFALKVLEHILTALIPANSEYASYAEAVEDLHMYATTELVRLSAHHADYFVTFYDQIESQLQQHNTRQDLDEKTSACLIASLFLIVQRASGIEHSVRRERLSAFLEPILIGWRNPEVQHCLSSFEEYTRMQLLDQVGPYMVSIHAAQLQDWSKVTLDAPGNQLRKEMLTRSTILPLRLSRTLLSVSTEKLPTSREAQDLLQDLWSPILPVLVQAVLQLVSYNHRLHDVSSWPNLPVEMRGVAQRILQDRYWQSGITAGTMHDFYAQVKSSKNTVEGFASSFRARIRNNLEHSYSIIHTLARLGDTFFNIPNVPETMSQTILSTSEFLSTHHFATLLSMLSKLVDDCPPVHRQRFLTPLMSNLLIQIDRKCTSEWQKLDARQISKSGEENLSDEMREDSILRSLTQRAVNMVAAWLDPQREQQKRIQIDGVANKGVDSTSKSETMRDFILSNAQILEPLLLFCTHALSFHDTKTCPTVVRAVRSLVQPFATAACSNSPIATGIREYVSHDLMRAAITALHDGHFVDYQRDIANLIATIWIAYGLPTQMPATDDEAAHQRPPLTDTPKRVLLSLPNMTEERVDEAATRLMEEGGLAGNPKHQRAVVLGLLEALRGVRLSELGKIDTSAQKSRIMEKYLKSHSGAMVGLVDDGQPPHSVNIEQEGIDLGGVPDMFG